MSPQTESRFYYRIFGWTAAFLIVAVALLYPHFCDYVDPDATAYFPLARRWANGEFVRAVNGYWSPASIWLTALGMKCGLAEVPAALLQNTVAALAFLGSSLSLFRRFDIPKRVLVYGVPALIIFFIHAVFWQWFSDLWGAAFDFWALALLMEKRFFVRPAHWVLYGLLGALAYLSKSVYLPFFLLQTILAFWLLRKEIPLPRRAAFTLLSVGTFLGLCLPWWIALRSHYGFWTTGVAGPLNLSWGVLGHPIYKGGEGHLLPPLFPDSVSFWEDPWWVNARTVHFWDSTALALHMVPRAWYFTTRLLSKAMAISIFLPLAWAMIFYRAFRNRFRPQGDFKTALLQAILVIFPLPFLLLHSEVRYLWFLVPITLIFWGKRFSGRLGTGILVLSFCVHPAIELANLWHLGRAEKALALQLKAQGISGDFAADTTMRYGAVMRVAYFSGMRYWAPAGVVPDSTLRSEMRQQGVKYLLHNGAMQPVE